MKLGLGMALACGVAGCAVPTTGVVPLSDDLHKVAHQGSGGWVTTASLKTAAIGEANDFCRRSNKQARVIDVKETQARMAGGWPEAEVLFKCE
ncbi:hypothetical protein DBA29_17235 [Xenophilus aerolatus]|nr:hypothetical protein [Xenophilus aerolatus]